MSKTHSDIPHGDSIQYKLRNVEGDIFDMHLTGPDSSYTFHVPRELSEGHVTLHKGSSASDSIVAATIYESKTTGQIRCGSEKGLQSSFETILNSYNTDMNFSSLEQGQSKWRWRKAYESEKKHAWSKTRNHVEWILTDITESSEGPKLATLILELPHPDLMLQRIQAREKGGDTGTFVWYSPATTAQEEQQRDMAIMSVLALWHRDRQTHYAEPLGPTVDVKIPGRTLGNSSHPWAWAGATHAGIGALGV